MSGILFRVDAGQTVALGHLQRSISLATALRNCGAACVFLTNRESGIWERITRVGFELETLEVSPSWTCDDLAETVEAAARHRCGAVLVDSHEVDSHYLSQLRAAGLFVIARDDLASYSFNCQMVINGNADAPRLPYVSASGDTDFMLGTQYIVLPEQFRAARPRDVYDTVRNILVILGGTDHDNLMPRMLGLLDGLPGDFEVTAVVGPFFQNVSAVKAAADGAERPVRLVHSPGSVHDLMLQADLAVSAAGQALYELASVGCPTVAIKVASNQDGQLPVLAEAGVLKEATGPKVDALLNSVETCVMALLTNFKARESMAREGQRMVDGEGAHKVAQRILAGMGPLDTKR